jgi:hypothetical protein
LEHLGLGQQQLDHYFGNLTHQNGENIISSTEFNGNDASVDPNALLMVQDGVAVWEPWASSEMSDIDLSFGESTTPDSSMLELADYDARTQMSSTLASGPQETRIETAEHQELVAVGNESEDVCMISNPGNSLTVPELQLYPGPDSDIVCYGMARALISFILVTKLRSAMSV